MSPRFLLAASLAALAAASSLVGCASTDAAGSPATASADSAARTTTDRLADAARPHPTLGAAHELQYTETFEVRFGAEHVGYLVDVLPVPGGIVDQRAYLPGTKLIESKDFEFLGFISPHGTTYRFDGNGEAKTVGIGSVEQGIAAFFKQTGPPTLVSISPGVRPAGSASGG